MNLSLKLIKLCESINTQDRINKFREMIFEGFISNRFNIQYLEDPSRELQYSIELQNVDSERLEFIKATIQDNIDSNTWSIKSEEVDNFKLIKKFTTNNGEVIIYYDNRTNNPGSVMFGNRGDSDNFFDTITVYNIPNGKEEPENEEPEEDNPMTPEGFAMRNENPDGTVENGESANGDDEGSLNIA